MTIFPASPELLGQRVAPLSLNEFGLMFVLALSVLVVMEVFKWVRQRA